MDIQGYYLRRSLQEQLAARNSASAEARKQHEDLAIAYEMRCLLAESSKGLRQVQPAA